MQWALQFLTSLILVGTLGSYNASFPRSRASLALQVASCAPDPHRDHGGIRLDSRVLAVPAPRKLECTHLAVPPPFCRGINLMIQQVTLLYATENPRYLSSRSAGYSQATHKALHNGMSSVFRFARAYSSSPDYHAHVPQCHNHSVLTYEEPTSTCLITIARCFCGHVDNTSTAFIQGLPVILILMVIKPCQWKVDFSVAEGRGSVDR